MNQLPSGELLKAAKQAREGAYARYSGFRVGAAIATRDGRIFTGCNIENASYSLTVCAERVAVWKAVSEGAREFAAVVVHADAPTPPCGACLQVLWELCGDIPVMMAGSNSAAETARLSDLLPRPFSASFLTD